MLLLKQCSRPTHTPNSAQTFQHRSCSSEINASKTKDTQKGQCLVMRTGQRQICCMLQTGAATERNWIRTVWRFTLNSWLKQVILPQHVRAESSCWTSYGQMKLIPTQATAVLVTCVYNTSSPVKSCGSKRRCLLLKVWSKSFVLLRSSGVHLDPQYVKWSSWGILVQTPNVAATFWVSLGCSGISLESFL